MKKFTLIGIVGLLLLFVLYGCNSYNGLVVKDTEVDKLWSNVDTQYQRRHNLISSLVKVVEGAANFEKSTLTEVINARSKATSIQLSPKDLTEENLAKFQAAQDQLNGSLSRLLVSVEQYPNLKANQNFLGLQAQLEGTENRIATARTDFNGGIKEYNLAVRTFPNNLFAGMFGFAQRAFFKASEAAQNAPDINFDFK